MSNLTIRINENLKKKAAKEAGKLGISLTFVVINALNHFIESPKITIGEPEDVMVTPDLQKSMDTIGRLISKKQRK
ncbi:MAG: hypothetical protein AAB588_00120 [Patescibacteria group bacterium]